MHSSVITNKYRDGSSVVLFVATHKFIGTIKYLKKVGVQSHVKLRYRKVSTPGGCNSN